LEKEIVEANETTVCNGGTTGSDDVIWISKSPCTKGVQVKENDQEDEGGRYHMKFQEDVGNTDIQSMENRFFIKMRGLGPFKIILAI